VWFRGESAAASWIVLMFSELVASTSDATGLSFDGCQL